MKPLDTISDLAALARAGFKMDDIKELMAQQAEEPAETMPKESITPEPEKASEETPTNEPDYKQMYEDLQMELKTTKKELETIQDRNASINVAGSVPSDQDLLNKLIGGY